MPEAEEITTIPDRGSLAPQRGGGLRVRGEIAQIIENQFRLFRFMEGSILRASTLSYWMLAIVCTASPSVPHCELAFDHPAGFCDTAFALAITAPGGKMAIYYTTNGEDPQPGYASLYTGPIVIDSTAVVRAAVFDSGTNLAGAAARTFLFIPDILNQTGARFPTSWGVNRGQPVLACYRMTTAKNTNAAVRQSVAAGLRFLPALSIIANPEDLFSPETGIYTHPRERGRDWERGVSLEMFEADGKLAFQCDCGLRIHGGTSRQPEVTPKHSFRLAFKKRYGAAALHFPLFGKDGVAEFDTLVLRAGNNDSWLAKQGEGGRRADYLRDEWMRRSMQDMGHPSARGRFVHLYLNGLYWGVYDLCESPGPALLAPDTGNAAAYDVRKADTIESGDALAWNKMMTLANAGVNDDRSYETISHYLDLPELADYLILNFYAGNSDWDRSANWVAIRSRAPGGRFQFLVWDGEGTLGSLDADTLDFDDDESPPRLFHKLVENEAFRKLFADRAQELLSQNGPLTPNAAAGRYRILAESVAPALTAEAARWGACRAERYRYRADPSAYTVEKDWKPEAERIQTQYFPKRRAVLLTQFRRYGVAIGDPKN